MSDSYGIDLSITHDGDLHVAPNGDVALASGVDNAIQALTLRMRTAHGSLPLHPEYGSRFATDVVGSKANPEIILAVARQELRDLVGTDRRFLAAREIEVTMVPTDHGAGAIVRVLLDLVTGETLAIGDLPTAQVDEVVGSDDPVEASIIGLDAAPLFNLTEEEDDLLADFSEETEAAIDLALADGSELLEH